MIKWVCFDNSNKWWIKDVARRNRKYLSRRQGLRERDHITSEEAELYDLPYALSFVKIPNGKNIKTIGNNGTKDDLYKIAQQVYESWGDVPFDERYSLRGKTPAIIPNMARLRTVSSQTKQAQK